MQHYEFLPKLILRTPKDSLSTSLSKAEVERNLKSAAYLESLYLASPSLYASVLAYNGRRLNVKQREKVLYANAKYMLRSKSRATPFGLFSGVGIVNWGGGTNLVLASKMQRKTRLDMQYLCGLLQALNSHPEIIKHLKFYANSSHYKLGEEIRYIEQQEENGKFDFQISSLETNEALIEVLKAAEHGATVNTLAILLISDEISQSDAEGFILGLIECQLIRSEFETALTGEELIDQILTKLEEIEHKSLGGIIDRLKEIKNELVRLDKVGINEVSKYQRIAALVSSIGVEVEENKLFHVDAQIQPKSGSTINKNSQKDLLEAISKLAILDTKKEVTDLETFKNRFQRRFGQREVSFLKVLDTEIGVGYGGDETNVYSSLLDDLVLPTGKKVTIRHDEISKKLFEALQKATLAGDYAVTFQSLELGNSKQKLDLAPTSAANFRLISENKIYLEGVGGSSALNILSRFGSSSTEIGNFLTEIAETEAADNPDIIFAEILHLPDTRIGNVLIRPASRKHEIPFLSKPTASTEFQVSLQDLFVSVRDGKVVLRDKRKNKIIIPRLSTSLDYKNSTLSVFKFLCELQHQGFQKSLQFDWGTLKDSFVFLPRVSVGNVVVHLATWQLENSNLEELQKIASNEAFQVWRKKLKLPSYFVISEGDNELLLDAENPFLVDLFLDAVRNKKNVVLKEFLLEETTPIKCESGAVMANQLIATIRRKEAIYSKIEKHSSEETLSKGFSFPTPVLNKKSNWVYFKIYCSPRAADEILQNGIGNIVQKAKEKELINRWFFIRYYDPDFHLRVRFDLRNKEDLVSFMALFEKYLKPLVAKGVLWQIEADIYEPEEERYRVIGVGKAEDFFHADSEAFLNYLTLNVGDKGEENKLLFSIRAIDAWLSQIGFELKRKQEFVEKQREHFSKEFKMDLRLKRQLDKKYRTHRMEISFYLNQEHSRTEEILKVRGLEKPKIKEKFQERISDSLIHMQINRCMSTQPRLYELIVYDFLFRFYTSQQARIRKK